VNANKTIDTPMRMEILNISWSPREESSNRSKVGATRSIPLDVTNLTGNELRGDGAHSIESWGDRETLFSAERLYTHRILRRMFK